MSVVYGSDSVAPEKGNKLTAPQSQDPQSGATPSPLADWGTRAAGFLIDYAPWLILEAIFFRSVAFRYLLSLVGIAYWAYLGHLDGVTGQTPGKAVMGIRLVNEQGELLGSGAGIGRKFLHILDAICLIGFLLPIVDAKRQTFADKLMTTYVVKGAEKRSFGLDLWRVPQQG